MEFPMDEFVRQVWNYAHLVKLNGVIIYMRELIPVKKTILFVSAMDKNKTAL